MIDGSDETIRNRNFRWIGPTNIHSLPVKEFSNSATLYLPEKPGDPSPARLQRRRPTLSGCQERPPPLCRAAGQYENDAVRCG